MKRALLATVLCAPLFVSSAHAFTPTRAEINACYEDSARFCGVTAADDNASALRRFAIGVCMLAHRNSVSLRCRAVFAAHGF